MNQRELKERIKNDPNLAGGEKAKKLREVAQSYLDRRRRRKEKRERHKEYRRKIREQQAAENSKTTTQV